MQIKIENGKVTKTTKTREIFGVGLATIGIMAFMLISLIVL